MDPSIDATFRFLCPHCGARLRAQADQAGDAFNCPKCGGAVRLPKPGERPAAAASAKSATGDSKSEGGGPDHARAIERGTRPAGADEPVYVPVVCAHCNTRMYATLADVGHKIECPDCGVKSVVREPVAEKPRTKPSLDDVEAYEVWDAEDDPNLHLEREPEAYVPVVCELCDTHLSATAGQIGEQVVCPDCGHRTRVKPPPKEAPKRTLPGVEMENRQPYQIGSPVATPAADQLVEMGGTEVDEDRAHSYGYGKGHREVAQLPPWPFVSGVWNFLWYPGVLPRVLVLWIWLTFAVYVISSGVAQVYASQYGALIGMPLIAGGTVCFALWLIVAAAIYLTVVSDTGNGVDEIEWPDAVFVDWMFHGFYFVTSYTFALLPAIALQFLPAGILDEFTLSLMSVGIAYALFPIALISMLENGSPINPFEPSVWSSVWRMPGRWIVCYVLVGIMVAAQLVGVMLVAQGGSFAAFVFGPGVVVVGMMFVYRLIGRLAFCCSMGATTNETDEEDV